MSLPEHGICLVGYTYREYDMRYAFSRAKKYGYDVIELRDFLDFRDENFVSLKKTLSRAKELSLKFGINFPVIFLQIDKYVGAEETMNELMQILSDYGISILHTHAHINLNGKPITSAEASEEQYRMEAEKLTMIANVAKRYAITISIETHMGTICDTTASTLKLINYVNHDFVKVSLDFANILILNRNENLQKTIERFKDKIGYTHLKNCKYFAWGYDWNVPLEMGDINYHKIIAKLLYSGYSGLFGIEYCGTGDPNVFASRDIKYLRQIIGEYKSK
jgi:sugar phosphate isomerase/epimerase